MGVTFAIASAIGQTYSQNKALEAQANANVQTARNYITSMNYSFQNLEQERRDSFEATIADLEKTKLQGNRQEATVAAAVNEGLVGGGRTAGLLKRSAEADTNRATSSIKENFSKRMNEIDLNKESALLNTKQNIKSIKEVEAPSLLSTLVNLGTAYYQAKTTQESIDAIRAKAGINSNSYGNSSTASSAMQYNPTTKTFEASYNSYQPNYRSLFGTTDFLSRNKFTFNYVNPFEKKTNNYF